jgi:aspartyl-tRNA(Asn)/glutamyl-tRNA(Gln) amidotransferase subunit C
MQITDELVDQLASLSRLSFTGEKKEAIKADLEKMTGFVEKLQALDTTGVEPLRHMSEVEDVLRADIPAPPMDNTEALAAAARHKAPFFTVPKVLG